MSAISITYAVLFYAATALMLFGISYKVWTYLRTPAPLKIPTTPAPTTRTGVVWRMVKEVTIFESLFKSNMWIWLFGWMFHFALLLAFLRHLRYILDPVPAVIVWVQPFGLYGAFIMLAGLAGLFARRILVDRVRYISSASDYLMLLLLMGIAGSGVWMSYIAHTDIVAVKDFFVGLLEFQIYPLPTDLPLLIHLSLVLVLMIIFPISKLMHAPGVFFSPTRNQVDNPREQRHLAPWAAELESNKK